MKRPTAEEIEAAKTPAGGWTRKTLESWGVTWPPKKGWKRAMIYPDEQVDGEFKPARIGEALNGGFLARLEVAAHISRFTESPIETMLGLALAVHLKEYGAQWSFVQPGDGWDYGADHFCLTPQLPWGRYRIDWALRRAGKPDIFIECDGNEFHTKPEDVARDQARDAAIKAAGIKVMRFTGAEIFNDAAGCASLIYQEAIC